jgi:hypothetical protein
MKPFSRFWSGVLLAVSCIFGRSAKSSETDKEKKQWEASIAARQSFYEAKIGALPADMVRLQELFILWTGGGFYSIHATKLQPACWVHTTYGLSDFGLPTPLALVAADEQPDGKGGTHLKFNLQKREPAPHRPGAAGYGYELVVLTHEPAEWPMKVLYWAAHAELLKDAGIPERVRKYDGFTVEKIGIGDDASVNILIEKAQAPVPDGADLPNGRMDLLVATVITDEEMQWSFEHGRKPMLEELQKAGVGQFSILNRKSVVK